MVTTLSIKAELLAISQTRKKAIYHFLPDKSIYIILTKSTYNQMQ